ncbi:MAG: agmatinase [Bacteroidetes bacterium]|nr:agmatinase [Bacteroidota bacterium]
MTREEKLAAFDPNGIGAAQAQIFGLPFNYPESRVVLLPVPWDATASYRPGSANGPEAIRQASPQLDLFDPDYPLSWQEGFFMLQVSGEWAQRNRKTRPLVAEYIRMLENGAPEDPALLKRVNDETEALRKWVFERTAETLHEGKIPGVIGGDHSTPLGAMQAVLARHPQMSILQVDAHADLRVAYEGFQHSHASIMYNALQAGVTGLVQVGLRDVCLAEKELINQDARVRAFFQHELDARRFAGGTWADCCRDAVAALSQEVWISFDIDGLDPSLCPNTGTPVPGGLSFAEASFLLGEVVRSGRRIVGFDLNEVAPAPNGEDEWDANVGARMLYRLCSLACLSQRS